jgi:AcrR family transcriptional regulator
MPDGAPTTRDRLLGAARDLFTTVGYHATTTPMLARQAGVAEGTIYRHFRSKQALLNAAYLDVQQWGLATVRAHEGAASRTVDRLSGLGREWVEVAERDPARVRLLLDWSLPGELDQASQAASDQTRHALEGLLALGKQEGAVRSGPVDLWATVWLALVTVAVVRVTGGEWSARHPHTTALLDAAWEAIAWRPIVPAPPGEVGRSTL